MVSQGAHLVHEDLLQGEGKQLQQQGRQGAQSGGRLGPVAAHDGRGDGALLVELQDGEALKHLASKGHGKGQLHLEQGGL